MNVLRGVYNHFVLLGLPFLVGLVFTLLITYPAGTQLTTNLIGDGGDSYQYAGFQQLVADNLSHFKWPFAHTSLWRYPQGFEFNRGYDAVLPNLFGASLLLLTNQPVLSYNLTVMSIFIFNFICAYFLFKEIGRTRLVGVLGATSFGLSFYVLSRSAGHLNLMMIGGFALLILALIKLYQRPSWPHFVLGGASVVLIVLASFQFVASLAILVGVAGSLFALTAPQVALRFICQLWSHKLKVVVTLTTTMLILAPFVTPIAQAYLKHDYLSRDLNVDFSPSLSNFVLPNPYTRLPLSQLMPALSSQQGIEYVAFIGWVTLILFGLAIMNYKHLKNPVFLVLAVLVFTIVAFGTDSPEFGVTLPYAWLLPYFPFSAIPQTSRFMVFSHLFALIAVAYYLKDAQYRFKGTGILSLLLVLLVLERLSFGRYYQLPPLQTDFIKAVTAQPGQAVFDLPMMEEAQSFYPQFYQKSVLGGSAHWLGNTPQSFSFLFADNYDIWRFGCYGAEAGNLPWPNPIATRERNQKLLQKLVANQISTIVLHKDNTYTYPTCLNVVAEASLLLPSVIEAEDSLGSTSLAQTTWSNKPLDVAVFFPRNGTVQIHGMTLEPSMPVSQLSLTLGDQTLPLSEFFTADESSESLKLTPKDTARPPFGLLSGQTLKLTGPVENNQHHIFKIWYTYRPQLGSPVSTFSQDNLELVFYSPEKEVFHISL